MENLWIIIILKKPCENNIKYRLDSTKLAYIINPTSIFVLLHSHCEAVAWLEWV